MLQVNFDANYQLRDIYRPYVGQENHTAGKPCRFGVWVDDTFRWIDDAGWQRSLTYLDDTLVSEQCLNILQKIKSFQQCNGPGGKL